MQRLQYYISFTVIYIFFSLTIIWLAKSRRKIIIKGVWSQKTIEKARDILIASILIVVSSIRMNVGSDYWSYFLIYNRILQKYSSVHEIILDEGLFSSGLYILSFYMKKITTSIGWNTPLENNLIFVMVSIFSTVVILRQIRKHSKDYYASIVVYFFMGFFLISNNILKQQIAMLIMMIAYDKCFEKKYLQYGVLCFIACVFHVTAIFPALAFLIITIYKPKKRELFFMIGVGTVISFLLPFILRWFSNASFLGYTKYFENSYAYTRFSVGSIYAIGTFLVYLYIYIMLYKHKERIDDKSGLVYSYISVIAIGVLINAFAFNFWLLIRISLYFYQFLIVLLPNAIKTLNVSPKKIKWIKCALIIYAAFYVVFSMDNHYFAYHTIYNEDMMPAFLDVYIELYE